MELNQSMSTNISKLNEHNFTWSMAILHALAMAGRLHYIEATDPPQHPQFVTSSSDPTPNRLEPMDARCKTMNAMDTVCQSAFYHFQDELFKDKCNKIKAGAMIIASIEPSLVRTFQEHRNDCKTLWKTPTKKYKVAMQLDGQYERALLAICKLADFLSITAWIAEQDF